MTEIDRETIEALKGYYKNKGAKLIKAKELKTVYAVEIMFEKPQSHLEIGYISKEVIANWKAKVDND